MNASPAGATAINVRDGSVTEPSCRVPALPHVSPRRHNGLGLCGERRGSDPTGSLSGNGGNTRSTTDSRLRAGLVRSATAICISSKLGSKGARRRCLIETGARERIAVCPALAAATFNRAARSSLCSPLQGMAEARLRARSLRQALKQSRAAKAPLPD